MKLVEIEEKKICGLMTRTKNAEEMNLETGKIGPLWKRFDETVEVDYKNGYRVYGVYHDYESDASGMYSLLAGTNQLDAKSSAKLETITIKGGKYLVFSASGDIPKIVVETWGKVWGYFSNGNAEYERLFTTDFEYYVDQNEIEIHIAVK